MSIKLNMDKLSGDSMKSLFTDPLKYETEIFKISSDDLTETIDKSILILLKQNFVQNLENNFNETLIVGDLHGEIKCIWQIINLFLEGKINSIIFLGDYVDRGKNSLAVLLMVLTLQYQFPDNIMMLKGNHEDWQLNERYGFTKDLKLIFKEKSEYEMVRDKLELLYDHLSIAAITPNGSLCVHGGIPVNSMDLMEINNINKPLATANLIKNSGGQRNKLLQMVYQIQWNDPYEKEYDGVEVEELDSIRGPRSHYFSHKYTKKFLKTNKLKRVIRAHESSRGGFQEIFEGHVLHIFSSEPYFGKIKKAYIIHEMKEKSILRDLDFNEINIINNPKCKTIS